MPVSSRTLPGRDMVRDPGSKQTDRQKHLHEPNHSACVEVQGHLVRVDFFSFHHACPGDEAQVGGLAASIFTLGDTLLAHHFHLSGLIYLVHLWAA